MSLKAVPTTLKHFTATSASRHHDYGTSQHLRKILIEEDVRCIADYYYAPAAKASDASTTAVAAYDATRQYSGLKERYKFKTDVKEFLSTNLFLTQVLLLAANQLDDAFERKVKLAISVLAEGESKKLFVSILSNLDVEDSITALSRFDETWWFHAPDNVRRLLEFTIDFE